MENKLQSILLKNELQFLTKQKEKHDDFMDLCITDTNKVDIWLIEAYKLDDVVIDWILISFSVWLDKLINNINKKINNCKMIEESTKNIDNLPF